MSRPSSAPIRSAFSPTSQPKWRQWLIPLCVLVPLVVFGLLAEDVASRAPIRFDDRILLRLHGHANTFFDAVMLAFSRIGGVPLLGIFPLLTAFWFWQKQRLRAQFFGTAMLGTCLLNVALKAAFQRTRPDLWLSIAPEHDSSFPSGHSMLSSTLTLALLVLLWHSRAALSTKLTATAVGALFVIGVISSRLYLGVHYPSDVLAGFALSFSWVSLLTGIFGRRLNAAMNR